MIHHQSANAKIKRKEKTDLFLKEKALKRSNPKPGEIKLATIKLTIGTKTVASIKMQTQTVIK